MRGLIGVTMLVAVAGCDLVFPPGKGPDAAGDDDTPGEWLELSTGYDHSCAIANDRTLWCWGHNDQYEIGDGDQLDRNVPVRIGGNAMWSKVAAGYYHTCGIQTDGAMYCWGADVYGELGGGSIATQASPTQIIDHATWSEVAAGARFTCALKTDGTLWCWGDNQYGQLGNGLGVPTATPIEIQGGGTWVHVSAGDNFACAVSTDGGLGCWGDNTYDQLGYTGAGSPTVRQVGTDLDWSAIAAGSLHACGLRDGIAMCWGYNAAGQCGNGSSGAPCPPSPVAAPVASWRAIAAGYRHACGLDDSGGLWCWGHRDHGAFADGSDAFDIQPTPVHLDAPRPYAAISLGGSVGCALGDDGAIDCTGANGNGQLGDGTGGAKFAPVQIQTGTMAANITTGGVEYGSNEWTCATLADGVWCWGNDDLYQLGDGIGVDVRSPAQRDTMTPAALEGGAGHGCMIKGSELSCWGSNTYGEIGNGTNAVAPAPVSLGTGWKAVSAMYHTCAIDQTGAVACWGQNTGYQLGDGSMIDRNMPTPISASTMTRIAAGARHTCGVTTDHLLQCWGSNDFGELGLGDTTVRATPATLGGLWDEVDAGDYHTCAIENATGALYCWGHNGYGQAGIGSITSQENSPTHVMGDLSWRAVSTGGYHTCAIAADDTLWCWGSNRYGQVGTADPIMIPAPVRIGDDTWTAVDAANAHTCGIRKVDGSVWCWGANVHGEIGDGTAWRPALAPIGN